MKKGGSVGGGSGSKTLPLGNSPARGAVDSPTLGRRAPGAPQPATADPADAIGTAVVKYNYQVKNRDKIKIKNSI